MKSSNCLIYRMNSAIFHQLVSQYDFADSLENRPEWCLFLSEEIPFGEIVGSTDNDDGDSQTVIDLLGI
ncbi:MAG: hypothetical protein IH585_03605 [Anaerolineaceae bacterium]|nr:hypothetical protein [Anaerolineaceae bacterium]